MRSGHHSVYFVRPLVLLAATALLAVAAPAQLVHVACLDGKLDMVASRAVVASGAGPSAGATARGTIAVAGIPEGAVVTHAWLCFAISVSSGNSKADSYGLAAAPADPSASRPLTPGLRVDKTTWYQQDVHGPAPVVTGNGTYAFSVPYAKVGGGTASFDGAGLMVVYSLPALAGSYKVDVFGGNLRVLNGTASVAFTDCFTAFGPAEARAVWFTDGPVSAYGFDGTPVLTGGAGFQVRASAVPVLAGATSGTAQVSAGASPAYWGLAAFRVRTRPADTTVPSLTLEPASGSVVGSESVEVVAHVGDESGVELASSPVPVTGWVPPSFAAPATGLGKATFNLVEGANTISVTATDTSGLSTTAAITIVRDTTPPAITITAPATGAVFGGAAVTLQAEVIDATGVTAGSVPSGIGPASLPAGGGVVSGDVALLLEGENALSVSATDAAGNTSSTSVTVIRDTTAPVVMVLTPADTVFPENPVRISFRVADATATSGAVAGVPFALGPGGAEEVTREVDGLVQGANTIHISVRDAAGNTASTSVVVYLDLLAPVVEILAPAEGTVLGPDQSPVAVSVRVDSLSSTTVTSSPAGLSGGTPLLQGGIINGSVPLAEGANTIQVTASDPFQRQSSAAVRVVLDTTPPAVAIVSPLAGATVRGTIDFEAAANDPLPGSGVAAVRLLVDGSLAGSGAVQLDTGALADGLHLLTVEAEDGVGNRASASIQISVDNTPPAVSIVTPAELSYVRGQAVQFMVAVQDPGSGLAALRLLVGGRSPTVDASVDYPLPVPADVRTAAVDTTQFPDAPLVLEARVVDRAGNESMASRTVLVDNAPAETTLLPANGSIVRGVIELAAATTDVYRHTLELRVDGVLVASTPASSLTVPFDTTERLDGPMVVTMTTRDLYGNVRPGSSSSVTLQVDNVSVVVNPRTLNLKSKGGEHSVSVLCEGVNVWRLLAGIGLELRVAGASPIAATAGSAVLGDANGNGIPDLSVKFDRQALIRALTGAIDTGALSGQGRELVCPMGVFAVGTAAATAGVSSCIGEDPVKVLR